MSESENRLRETDDPNRLQELRYGCSDHGTWYMQSREVDETTLNCLCVSSRVAAAGVSVTRGLLWRNISLS